MRNIYHRARSHDPERPHPRDRGPEPSDGRPDDGPRRHHGPPAPEGRGPEHRGPEERSERGRGERGRGERRVGGRGGGRGPRRAQRGDVRTAILLLLADQPMHGYQLMQAISDRTNGAWRPSPGAVYPTIDQLEDEGLATIQADAGRRLVTLTSAGQSYLAEHGAALSDPFAGTGDAEGPDLRDALHQLQVAARQIAVSGDSTQVESAAQVLAQARRSLYLILAGEPDPSTKG